jgi:hypothetical protein
MSERGIELGEIGSRKLFGSSETFLLDSKIDIISSIEEALFSLKNFHLISILDIIL